MPAEHPAVILWYAEMTDGYAKMILRCAEMTDGQAKMIFQHAEMTDRYPKMTDAYAEMTQEHSSVTFQYAKMITAPRSSIHRGSLDFVSVACGKVGRFTNNHEMQANEGAGVGTSTKYGFRNQLLSINPRSPSPFINKPVVIENRIHILTKKPDVTMKTIFPTVMKSTLSVFLTLLISVAVAQNQKYDFPTDKEEENLNVFHQWLRWNNPGNLFIHDLVQQASDRYAERDAQIAKLSTAEDWIKRQEWVREKLGKIIGPFPAKSPLRPRVTGVIKKDGYRIEKIVFESYPNFYVTGCLYIPEKVRGKVPAILNVMGHNQESFRNELYQVINVNLVKKGMIVFAIDPPGQGEHVQLYDDRVKFSAAGYSVVEHCYVGNQCFLSGSSVAKYFIWDGIRAIDYLVSRKEVDPARIGVTGFSGGGTVTTYISAFDPRVKVSVPCSWSTASRRQMETKGAQDAESEFYRGLAEGITLEDLIEVRAPKPTLMTFTSRDEYLTLQGAMEAYHESKKAFDLLGQKDNLQFSEDDSKHWMTLKIRNDIYAFFMKHFGIQGDPTEQAAELLSYEELNVTPTGQATTFLGGDVIFDVNKKESEILISNLEKSRLDVARHLNTVVAKAKQISGYIEPSDYTPSPFLNGRYRRDGYTVAKYGIKGEGNYALPLLLFIPDDRTGSLPALVYLHPEGKAAAAKQGGEIEQLVKRGYVVVAPDLPGIGELDNKANRYAEDYTAVMLGRSIPGIQAGDIIRVVEFLKSRPEVNPGAIGAVGIRTMAIPLLHVAAFNTSIQSVILVDALISYRSVAMTKLYKLGLIARPGGGYWHPYEVEFSWGVAGALTAYDLPDLMGCIAPRKIMLAGLQDATLAPVSATTIAEELNFPRAAYAYKQAVDHFSIKPSSENLGAMVDECFK